MIEIALSGLKNNVLFTLCKRIYELILSVKTEEMGIDFYFGRFEEAYAEYKAAMEKSVLSAAEIAEKDSFRDRMWSALRIHVKNYLRHPLLGAKATPILNEIDKYGKQVVKQSYEAESAIIHNLTETLESGFTDDLAAMHADEWLSLLKDANTDFETTLRAYNAQKSNADEVDAATSVRPGLEEALRKLLTFLPMQAEVTGNSGLNELVKQLEVEVSRF
ncbi:DUF6261 family protein [Prolixibacter sp. NT017]|uniref:DUF6261 family protein n=1 Tax=Prolixibacter sp. NT017 TaxID=2652390 RepID=UPI001286E171|nr:DUF6261 family protein [Prolixibacter sp. NT017]GET24735.1 hypothetical protein NT017_10640 [Prolixibacter sp. NT017]